MLSQPSLQYSATYSQWVRQMLSQMQSAPDMPISLFESSVPEPVELLSRLVKDSFGEVTTSRYQSAFAGGNAFVKAQLAKNYGVEEASIVTTTGATGALSLIYRALLKPGDRVLVENPGFDLFGLLAEAHGFGVDRFERRGPSFAIDPDAVEAAIGPATRIVVISNLHNPSGFAVEEEVLHALGAMAERRDLILVVDEVYLPYAGSAKKSAAQLQISPRVLSVNSLTKIYGLSTLRCGWIVGDPAAVQPIHALSREVEFSISKLAHAVAALVLEKPEAFLLHTELVIGAARPLIESFHRQWLDEGLVEGALPAHGCIIFPRLIGIPETRDFSGWLAEKRGVLVAPGEYFGASEHIRIGFGIDASRLDYGLQVLTDALKEYRQAQGTVDSRRVSS